MGKPIKVLLVEDSEDDVLLVINELKKGGYEVTFERVETKAGMKAALDKEKWDIILSDYQMPNFAAPEALVLAKERDIDLPFIVISGTIGEDVAVNMMKQGAHDYIMKGNLIRLCADVAREVQEANNRRKQKKAELELKRERDFTNNILNSMSDGLDVVDKDGTILFMNKSFKNVFGEESLGKKCYEVYRDDKKQCSNCPLKEGVEFGKSVTIEVSGIAGGKTFFITHTKMKSSDGTISILEIFKDITETKKNQEETKEHLRELEIFYEAAMGREEKMLELKQEVDELKSKLGEKS